MANPTTARPRIFLNPPTLARLKAQVAAKNPRWISLKATCDGALATTNVNMVPDFALAYAVTRDEKYAQVAYRLISKVIALGLPPVSADSGYGARTYLPFAAYVYDWCRGALTPAELTFLKDGLILWADWVWPETNPPRAGKWGVNNPGDNYYHGFLLGTWMAGLALYGDSPKGQAHVDLAVSKWKNTVVPYLDTKAKGGYLAEGTTYGTGSLFRMLWYLGAHYTATGDDLRTGWNTESLWVKMLLTTPDMKRNAPLGDQPRDSKANLSDYDRSVFLASLIWANPGGDASQWWLDAAPPNHWDFTRWEEFLFYQDDLPPVPPTGLRPQTFAPGAGLMTATYSWLPNATQLHFQCGPFLASHNNRAAGEFLIWRGEWMVAAAVLNSASGLAQAAWHNNALTVDERDQNPEQASAAGIFFEAEADYVYMAGEAGAAYDWRAGSVWTRPLKSWKREILWLKPDLFLVHDTLIKAKATTSVKWNLNTLTEPVLERGSWKTIFGNTRMLTTTLLPEHAVAKVRPVLLGAGLSRSGSRLEVEGTPTANARFLNAIYLSNNSSPPFAPQLVETPWNNIVGALQGRLLGLFVTAKGPWTIPVPVLPIPGVVVAGLTPGQRLNLAVSAGGPVTSTPLVASAAGVVRFNALGSGAGTIRLEVV